MSCGEWFWSTWDLFVIGVRWFVSSLVYAILIQHFTRLQPCWSCYICCIIWIYLDHLVDLACHFIRTRLTSPSFLAAGSFDVQTPGSYSSKCLPLWACPMVDETQTKRKQFVQSVCSGGMAKHSRGWTLLNIIEFCLLAACCVEKIDAKCEWRCKVNIIMSNFKRQWMIINV